MQKVFIYIVGLKGLGTCGLRIRLEAHLDEINSVILPWGSCDGEQEVLSRWQY